MRIYVVSPFYLFCLRPTLDFSIAPWGENEPGYFAMMEISTNKKIVPKIVLEENTWGEAS